MIPTIAWGQVEGIGEGGWRQYLEDWAELNEVEELPDELVELLEGFREAPFNLNDTSSTRLLELPFVSDFQWECIKSYILQNGEMLSVNELRLVNGFDSTMIRMLRPLVVANQVETNKLPSLRTMLTRGHHNLVMGSRRQVELSRGYTDSIYAGSPYRQYFRYYYKYGNHLHLQLSGDKDPGEEFFRGSQKQGFDHYGGFLLLNDLGRLRRMVAGHYNLQFGQGLTLWSGYAPWAGYDANQRRYGSGIRGAGATAEYGYLQGFAATVELAKGLDFTAFASYQNLDGTPSSTDSLAVQSIYNSGYHRTENELSKRNLLTESLYGAHLGYQFKGLSLGATAYHSHYSKDILPREYAYNYFYFRGKDNTVYGLDAAYRYRRWVVFGEVSASSGESRAHLLPAHWAAMAGVQLDINGDNHLGVTYRNYSAGYHNLNNAPIRQSGSAPNEQGTLVTFQTKLPGNVQMVASTDLFSHNHVHYGTYGPSFGTDTRLRLIRNWGRRATLTAQYRYRSKGANVSLSNLEDSVLMDEYIYIVEQTLRQQMQVRLDLSPTETWHFSSRAVLTHASCEYHLTQQGLLLLQDVAYDRAKLSVVARYAYFNTGGYDSRVYAMESDMIYEFATPSHQGRGHRAYLVARWRPNENVTFSAKYALTRYTDGRVTVGSGYDITQGPLRQEVKVQMRLRFLPSYKSPKTDNR